MDDTTDPSAVMATERSRPLISVVIPTFNQWSYTERCLQALAETAGDFSHEVIVVDNGSSDQTPQKLPLQPGIRYQLCDSNLGFARACNRGAAMATAPCLLFLNNDTEPRPGWLSPLLQVLDSDAAISVVGSQLLFPEGVIQSAGFRLFYGFPYPVTVVPRDYRKPPSVASVCEEISAVSGACLMARTTTFRQLGGFDEGYTSGYEDVDLCLRVREAGGRVVYVSASQVMHHEAVSGGRFAHEAANLDRLQRRWMDSPHLLDFDYRRRRGSAPPSPRQEGVSVVIVARDALGSAIPCLESVLCHLGAADEIILVDDGSWGASAALLGSLARQHPTIVLLVNATAQGFTAAAHRGLQRASRPWAVVMAGHLKVGPHWLDRLVKHATAEPGVISAACRNEGDSLFLPQMAVEPDLQTAPALTAVPIPRSACLFAARSRLLTLADEPDIFLGPRASRLGERLREDGEGLFVAHDVGVRPLHPLGDVHPPSTTDRYVEGQSRNLALELAYQHGSVQGDLVSIIILVRDNLALTLACIESIFRHTHCDFELILVDNGSTPDVADAIAQLQRRRNNIVALRNEDNEGFAFGSNQGLAVARGTYVVLLNNDVAVTPGWLSLQLALLQLDPGIGMVGPTTNATSGPQLVGRSIYRGVGEADRFAVQWHLEHRGEFAFVPRLVGLCVVMRRSLIDQVGGFDTAFGYGNCEDDDLCLRVARAGHQIAIAFDVFVHHHGSSTFKSLNLSTRDLVAQNWEIFCEKWQHPRDGQSLSALQDLARAKPFDPEVDFIPVEYGEIFHPGAPPLDLDTQKHARLLCIPDWRNDRWKLPLGAIMRSFVAADSTALVVRVEPPGPGQVERAVAEIQQLLRDLGLTLASVCDIVVEGRSLPPRRRGGLYTASTLYVRCGGARDKFYAREAAACGLPVVDLAVRS